MAAAKADRQRARHEEVRMETPALVDQLVRLDHAEDEILAKAAGEAQEAERHAARACELVAAAGRIDAAQDETVAAIRANERERGALDAAVIPAVA